MSVQVDVDDDGEGGESAEVFIVSSRQMERDKSLLKTGRRSLEEEEEEEPLLHAVDESLPSRESGENLEMSPEAELEREEGRDNGFSEVLIGPEKKLLPNRSISSDEERGNEKLARLKPLSR